MMNELERAAENYRDAMKQLHALQDEQEKVRQRVNELGGLIFKASGHAQACEFDLKKVVYPEEVHMPGWTIVTDKPDAEAPTG